MASATAVPAHMLLTPPISTEVTARLLWRRGCGAVTRAPPRAFSLVTTLWARIVTRAALPVSSSARDRRKGVLEAPVSVIEFIQQCGTLWPDT